MDECEQLKRTVGFGLPHDESSQVSIDLNRQLIAHPHASFMFRMKGNAMRDEGISEGDIVLVDRAVIAQDGQMVLAVVDNRYLVRRVRIQNNQAQLLMPGSLQSLAVDQEQGIVIWGVVRFVIKEFIKS